MTIIELTKEHLTDAYKLVKMNYEEQRLFCPWFPKDAKLPDLSVFAENHLGVAATENGRLLGFLGCYRPRKNAFGSRATGVYSPLHAHGAVSENRTRIYQYLYERAAEIWVASDIRYHTVTLYTDDSAATDAFVEYGFGRRCIDAATPLTDDKTVTDNHTVVSDNLRFYECPHGDFPKLRGLRRELADHLGKSPCFMPTSDGDFQNWITRIESGGRRTFVAETDGRVIAYLDIEAEGENFITGCPTMRNIQGAYCVPDYRGTGIIDGLLIYVKQTLYREGYSLLGVDYESFNPTAVHFWKKHFYPYTNSFIRRIDEES